MAREYRFNQRTVVEAGGDYTGFPTLASADGVLLAAYRRSRRHLAARGGLTVVVRSTTNGGLWGQVDTQTSYMSATGTWEVSPTGLVGIPARGGKPREWIMQRLHRRFDESIPRRVDLIRSTDDGVTWSAPQQVTFPGVPNPFSSDLVWVDDGTTDGVLYQAQYTAQLERGRRFWEPQWLRSTNRGASWTELPHIVPDEWVTGTSAQVHHISEPKLLPLPDGRLLCTMREDKFRGTGHTSNSLFQSWYTPATNTWSPVRRIISNGNGMPNTFRLSTGEILLLVRDFTRTTNALGKWSWAISTDDGGTFIRQQSVPWGGVLPTTGTTYGAMIQLPGGDVGAMWGAETLPSRVLGAASNLYWSRLTVTDPATVGTLTAVQFDALASPPFVRIETTAPRVERVRQDTGAREQVRGVPVAGVLRDFDAPQGVRCLYVAYDRGAEVGSIEIEIPEFGLWLIPAAEPGLAAPLQVELEGYSGGIELPAWEATLDIPGGRPYTVQAGYAPASGSMKLIALDDWTPLRDALTVPGPKFLSAPAEDWPIAADVEWVTTGSPKATPLGKGDDAPTWEVNVEFRPASRPEFGDERTETASWARLIGVSWGELRGKPWGDLAESQ